MSPSDRQKLFEVIAPTLVRIWHETYEGMVNAFPTESRELALSSANNKIKRITDCLYDEMKRWIE